MKVKSKIVKYLFLLFFLFFYCAGMGVDEVQITGKVQLSDNPENGHGDVYISCLNISTISTHDGSFVLKGDVTDELEADVVFYKEGYVEKKERINIPYPAEGESNTIEVKIGTIRLEKK